MPNCVYRFISLDKSTSQRHNCKRDALSNEDLKQWIQWSLAGLVNSGKDKPAQQHWTHTDEHHDDLICNQSFDANDALCYTLCLFPVFEEWFQDLNMLV